MLITTTTTSATHAAAIRETMGFAAESIAMIERSVTKFSSLNEEAATNQKFSRL